VILAGSASLGVAVAAQPLNALVAGIVVVVGYMARGPIERWGRGFRPRAWDRKGTLAYGMVAALGVAVLARVDLHIAAMIAAVAIAFPAVGVIVTRARVQRSGAIELVALTVCGGVCGAIALAGAASWSVAVEVGAVMAVYGAGTVGVVRAETRGDEEPYWAVLGVVVLLLGAAGSALLNPWLALALGPRATHALVRWAHPPEPLPIMRVAARECVELAGFLALVVLLR
jgi:hypothetical protein